MERETWGRGREHRDDEVRVTAAFRPSFVWLSVVISDVVPYFYLDHFCLSRLGESLIVRAVISAPPWAAGRNNPSHHSSTTPSFLSFSQLHPKSILFPPHPITTENGSHRLRPRPLHRPVPRHLICASKGRWQISERKAC